MKTSIKNAIAAHKTWVHGLSEALAKQELPPELDRAGYDDMCEFGKWLYSLDDRVKITQPFRLVKDLHYRFHLEAEGVVKMAAGGDFDGARLLSNGQFFRTSQDLIDAMEAWKTSL